MVFNPSNKMVVGCYDDADFVGLGEHENPQDSICGVSRNGFVVKVSIVLYCGCQEYRQILFSLL